MIVFFQKQSKQVNQKLFIKKNVKEENFQELNKDYLDQKSMAASHIQSQDITMQCVFCLVPLGLSPSLGSQPPCREKGKQPRGEATCRCSGQGFQLISQPRKASNAKHVNELWIIPALRQQVTSSFQMPPNAPKRSCPYKPRAKMQAHEQTECCLLF